MEDFGGKKKNIIVLNDLISPLCSCCIFPGLESRASFWKFSKLKNLFNNLKAESWSCETRASRLNTLLFSEGDPLPRWCNLASLLAKWCKRAPRLRERLPSPPPHSLCEIQMPFPSARRAPSRPNKSGGVVYRELLNVNLAEPAAIAAVCGGMSVITQTDKHKHTQKAHEGSDCTITHTHKPFFF